MVRNRALSVLLVLGCSMAMVSCPEWWGGGNLVGDKTVLKEKLAEAGFVVDDKGVFTAVNPVLQFCEGTLPNALGQNADTPYLLFKMDPTASGFYSWGFQLRPDDALVFIGKTPPEAVYFSFTAFLNVRYYPELQKAKMLMANLGDSLNQCVIKTSGSAKGNPFDADTVVIVTADKATETKVRESLDKAGYSNRIVNTMVIPSDTVRLGTDPQDDRMCILTRCAFFKDPAAGAAYLGWGDVPEGETVSTAGVIWRVTPDTPAPEKPVEPLCEPPLRVHGTGYPEFDLWPDVEALRAAILAAYPDYDAFEFDTEQFLAEGAEAIQRGINVLAPSRDTVYLRTHGTFTLAEDEFVVVYGVNHAAAGKALYSNAVLYAMDPVDNSTFQFEPNLADGDIWRAFAGIGSINSVEDMQDSVQAFLPADAVPVNEHGEDLLYARKIKHTCDVADPVTCTSIPASICERMPQNEFNVAFRAYVEPETLVGPAYNELVYDRVIKFTPKAVR
ncbi:MAG: hypothetical protein QG656_1948 [Candidatus Hydrogenedentes bacterium]|nr:hypothetical protein [Candidatus Hydrogenedentota bacterium]